ncbi:MULTISPECIES: GntR family transcriptional regulator [unclassified Massilia]|uniref:GntR family transcriptional regulator n=1 Tax=unclassified Massilia TaxID=2609279 RepID=UPI001784285B|nr:MULTISPECIES: GntR family transcriptional regulator [unclassified Massilia]MBD8529203.1 GntR family transcriptional regulator [Massilia sp. CFBP 13647]MBD8672597.1 GntR family transcriptional regulator [Massilia sp. CFBP 13721]
MATHTAQLFSITTGSSEPIYRQLVEQVRRLVAAGQLAPGDGMPSVREVAQVLALNPMTVSKAYGLLEMEGLLARQRGMGMRVAERAGAARSTASRAELLRPTLERAALEARQLELDSDTVLSLFTLILKEQA